jgi:glycosyltransferase involved in cell wall biosynthesis
MSKLLIHIFGDSHCKCFIHDRYNNGILNFDGITISNNFKSSASLKGVTNKQSTLNYRESIIDTLKLINEDTATRKVCVLKFGQVDIEHNYYYKIYYKNEVIDKDEFYTKLINDYIVFIKFLQDSFPDIQFMVNGVNMPNVYNIQKYLQKKVPLMPEVEYTDQFDNNFSFNIKLQNACNKNDISYFDLTAETTDNKKIKQEFVGDDNHFIGAGSEPNFNTHNLFINKLLKNISDMNKKKLLIYIVSFQRKEYTIGTIKCIHEVKPKDSQIIVCDNGSTDGTREWLNENQEKYGLGLLFPEENLRVGGAWTLLTNYFQPTDFDYILLLDNDNWMIPDPDWFKTCIELFKLDNNIGSIGLFNEKTPGYYAKDSIFDENFNNRLQYKNLEYYDTVYYAAARLDKFSLWHHTMKNWTHKFIGDKIGRYYNDQNYRTIKLHPGFIIDISVYNFNNPKHEEYNKWFYSRERNENEYKRVSELTPSNKDLEFLIKEKFGDKYLKYVL